MYESAIAGYQFSTDELSHGQILHVVPLSLPELFRQLEGPKKLRRRLHLLEGDLDHPKKQSLAIVTRYSSCVNLGTNYRSAFWEQHLRSE